MLTMKKDVFESIKKKLEREKSGLRIMISANKHSMKRLAEEQSRLKRELAALDHLISSMTVKKS